MQECFRFIDEDESMVGQHYVEQQPDVASHTIAFTFEPGERAQPFHIWFIHCRLTCPEFHVVADVERDNRSGHKIYGDPRAESSTKPRCELFSQLWVLMQMVKRQCFGLTVKINRPSRLRALDAACGT